jgi:hydrolase, P-loop family
MDIKIFESFSDKETFDIAFNIATGLKTRADATVVCLDGDLGVGKTVFAKGFGAGLGIKKDIVSPTFNIVKSYEGEKRLHHFDVYRISDISELDEIGFEEFLYDDAIVLIEWSKLIEEALPENIIKIVISKDLEKGFDYRKITVEGMKDEDFRD